MSARKVTYAPRESVGADRDPQRWCRLGKHIPIPYKVGAKICAVCQQSEPFKITGSGLGSGSVSDLNLNLQPQP